MNRQPVRVRVRERERQRERERESSVKYDNGKFNKLYFLYRLTQCI